MATQVLTSWGNNEFSKDDKIINWNWNNWETGTPITQTKLENLEEGIAILATQMQAILGEIGTATYSDLISNSSRLDNIQKWITNSVNGSYSNSSSIATRLDSIDTLNGQQNTRLTNIETVNTAQTSDINALKIRATNIENLNSAQNGRLDSIETKNSNQDGRLDAIDTLNINQNGKLENLETRTTNIESLNIIQNGRLDNIESKNTEQDNRLGNIETLNTTQNNRLTAIENLDTNQNTRLNNIETHDASVDKAITAIKNELGGTYVENSGFTNSRVDTLESTSTSYGTRLNDIESKNTIQDNKLTAIMNELGGTGNDGSDTIYGGTSRLDDVITEVWGSNTTTENSRIDGIENHNTSIDKAISAIKAELGGTYEENIGFTNSRIDILKSISDVHTNELTAIKAELGGTYEENGSFTNSRIDAIETLNTTQNTRLDSIETLDIIQNGRLDSVESVNDTQNNRIDSLELKVGNGAIGVDADISAAIRRLSGTVTALDPTGSAEATSFLVSEVWGHTFSEDTDFAADSRIDILETTTQNLGTQLITLATEQSTLEQNLAATNAKIPIEMYIATNSSASDTVILDAAPQDKSIFFIAVPRGTLGANNLILQTNDIQFNDVIVKKTYNGEGIKIKYAPNSLISIYRNGSNAYVYNVPMVL